MQQRKETIDKSLIFGFKISLGIDQYLFRAIHHLWFEYPFHHLRALSDIASTQTGSCVPSVRARS